MKEIRVVVIVGPTASGKSSMALDLAEEFDGEIVTADSMQVYRFMDIGTAKPTAEERRRAPHHLIDMVSPDEVYTVAHYRDDAAAVIDDIHSRGRLIILAGGSGLYIRALTKGLLDAPPANPALREELEKMEERMGRGYLHNKLREVDPSLADSIHPHNRVRIIRALEVATLTKQPLSRHQNEHGFGERPYRLLTIGLTMERSLLYRRIEGRVDSMIEDGLEGEVRGLLEMGCSPSLKSMGGLGYKEMAHFIGGGCSREEAIGEIKKKTRNYAKRQLTWFRRDEDVEWFTAREREIIRERVEGFLQ
ncbi:MAG: tRNA (adenosine(37)-N6)-dimethylallyltransferase MiaA [Thermodesulfobacteriota bacterium]